MNYFFGFGSKLAQNIDWFFNLNHLMLIIYVAGFIVLGSFLLSAKSEKGKKVTKLALAIILFTLEIGRIVYKFLLHKHNGGSSIDFDWWWTISFQMCAIMSWTTIITLVLSAFLDKNNKFLQFMYNILWGCALVGGVLTFCYPDCITGDRAFFHFLNFQTITVHALLIFVPIYLIKIKEFKVEIKNIWKTLVGYVAVGCIAMSASLISNHNFAFSLKFDLVDLGLPFPWHLPVVMLALFAFDGILYGSFEIVRLIKKSIAKKKQQGVDVVKERSHINGLSLATYITSNICAIFFGALIMLLIAVSLGKGASSWLGLCCMFGLVYMILLLIFAETHKKYLTENFEENKQKHIALITLTFIFALPVGILYLVDYLKQHNQFIQGNKI